MGVRVRGYLAYREGDRGEALDQGCDLARDGELYRLLANVYGGGPWEYHS